MNYVVSAQGAGYIDIETLGELYRWEPGRHVVTGPDGTEYDETFFADEWSVDLDECRSVMVGAVRKPVNIDAVPSNADWVKRPVGPCPCECNSGGFCGGCGHAGCGGRR